jgi:hypothetical protein
MKKVFTAAVIGVAAIGMSGGVAGATPGPTGDQGLVGACNMVNTHALPGMILAITTDNPNGYGGMGHAALLTSGSATC